MGEPTEARMTDGEHEDDLDLSEYDQWVAEHALWGAARARLFADRVEGRAWGADLVRGELSFDGLPPVRAQLLGTFSKEGRTFLWGWANPGAGSWGESLQAVEHLRSLGGPGLSVFQQDTVAEGWVHPLELCWVSAEVIGGLPLYQADAGPAIAMLAVEVQDVEVAELPLVYLPGLLVDFQSCSMVEARPCVERFLARLGFVEDPAGGWSRADGSRVTLTWDGEGRLSQVQLAAVPPS
jgi:hypothetical protein